MENKKNFGSNQFVVLIILILVGIGSTHYILSKIPEKITASMLSIEYEKVGGMKNYVKINDIQREQAKTFLKEYETQNGQIQVPINKAQVPSNALNKISQETIKKIKNGAYILGNPDAEITFIEYSDLECPYCKRLHESGTIEEIIELYDGKVNFIFKQFPLTRIHPNAPMESEAALCVGELGGKDKYYEFINKTYKNSKTNGRSYTKESIAKLGAGIGLDEVKLLSCINSGKFETRTGNELSEGSTLFGITGTPGNVLLNNKTGVWDKLPGAYPTSAFKQKIDNLIDLDI